VCDDASVEQATDGVRLAPPCHLGTEWLSARLDRPAHPAATIDGAPADVESALARAGELLRGARRPLLYGFDSATVEDARAAVALADRLGALMSVTRVDEPWPGAPAVPVRGASTATLGEIRDRSGLVIIWRQDPEASHPRLLDRLALGGGRAASARFSSSTTATPPRPRSRTSTCAGRASAISTPSSPCERCRGGWTSRRTTWTRR
jgi:formylmethanofuran dehydrogenase subunit B